MKFQDPEELDKKIQLYFATEKEEDWTWTGLALFLDTDKRTLVDYREERPEFMPSLKRAMLKIENGYEKDLKHHGRTGTIFALKNLDWKDKSELDSNIKGELNIGGIKIVDA